MPLDINGYVLSNSNGLKLGASESRIVTASYGIRDPMLPGFMGAATAGGTYKSYPFRVNDVNPNIGSPWNVSTYRFTAPVAGIYYTSYSGIVGNGSGTSGGNGYFAVIVNGSNWYFSYKDTLSIWELMHLEVMLNLAAGDWVSWAMNMAPGPDAGGDAGGYHSSHNTCAIWLVG